MTTTSGATSPAARAAEDFLRSFHDRNPGFQSAGVEKALTRDGRTSHAVLAAHVPGARRVLDLGRADGALLELLAGQGAGVLAGIDLSEGELALARRRPSLADADLRQGRAQELPFADNSFDAVVSHMALMLMSDPEQVTAEAARVLAPGGTPALAVGGGAVPGEGADLFLTPAVPYFRAAPPERGLPRLGDRRTRGREGLDALLSPLGFTALSWRTVVIGMDGTPSEVWSALTSTYYDMEVLDEERTADLRAAFLDRAAALTGSDGQLPCGMRVNVAAARWEP
ncbi:methyltransferase domain-containing protein [Streptomyces sp. NPDC046977]|uniref:class I SAM-dependent methyltransferase n=1 Tax=Streptomyces sp. NPDC046977 TaxID=3154703 RepID=UPI00340F76E5